MAVVRKSLPARVPAKKEVTLLTSAMALSFFFGGGGWGGWRNSRGTGSGCSLFVLAIQTLWNVHGLLFPWKKMLENWTLAQNTNLSTIVKNLNPSLTKSVLRILLFRHKCFQSIDRVTYEKKIILALSFTCLADIFRHPSFDILSKQEGSKSTNHSPLA